MMHNGRKAIRWQDVMMIPLFLLAATGIGILFDAIGFPETNIVLVYVAAVLLVARFTHGLYYGLMASVIAIFAFNYFFTDPRFTFAVNDTSYLITFMRRHRKGLRRKHHRKESGGRRRGIHVYAAHGGDTE